MTQQFQRGKTTNQQNGEHCDGQVEAFLDPVFDGWSELPDEQGHQIESKGTADDRGANEWKEGKLEHAR